MRHSRCSLRSMVSFGNGTGSSLSRHRLQGLGSAIIRVRQSKTAIHTNGLHESRGGYYVPGPSPRPNSPDADGSNGSYPNGHRQQRPAAIGLRREDEFNSYPSDRRRFQRSPHSSPADFRSACHEARGTGVVHSNMSTCIAADTPLMVQERELRGRLRGTARP